MLHVCYEDRRKRTLCTREHHNVNNVAVVILTVGTPRMVPEHWMNGTEDLRWWERPSIEDQLWERPVPLNTSAEFFCALAPDVLDRFHNLQYTMLFKDVGLTLYSYAVIK